MIDRRRVRRLEFGIDHWLMLLVILAVMFVQVRAARGAKESATHALLINGGNKASSNVQSHLHHLEDMVVELEGRGLPRENVHVFSADSEQHVTIRRKGSHATHNDVLFHLGDVDRSEDVRQILLLIFEGTPIPSFDSEPLRELVSPLPPLYRSILVHQNKRRCSTHSMAQETTP